VKLKQELPNRPIRRYGECTERNIPPGRTAARDLRGKSDTVRSKQLRLAEIEWCRCSTWCLAQHGMEQVLTATIC